MTPAESASERAARLERVAFCLGGSLLGVLLVVALAWFGLVYRHEPKPDAKPVPAASKRAEPDERNAKEDAAPAAPDESPVEPLEESSVESPVEPIPPELADVDWEHIFDEPPEENADEDFEEDDSEEDPSEENSEETDEAEEPGAAAEIASAPYAIVLPDDFETLAEALEAAPEGGEIVLRKREKPYYCVRRGKRGERPEFALALKSVTIRSETDKPGDVAIRGTLVVAVKGDGKVVARGVSLDGGEGAAVEIGLGTAEFSNCVFRGRGECELRVGPGACARARLCVFAGTADCGICALGDARTIVERAWFRLAKTGIFCEPDVTGYALECEFDNASRACETPHGEPHPAFTVLSRK